MWLQFENRQAGKGGLFPAVRFIGKQVVFSRPLLEKVGPQFKFASLFGDPANRKTLLVWFHKTQVEGSFAISKSSSDSGTGRVTSTNTVKELCNAPKYWQRVVARDYVDDPKEKVTGVWLADWSDNQEAKQE